MGRARRPGAGEAEARGGREPTVATATLRQAGIDFRLHEFAMPDVERIASDRRDGDRPLRDHRSGGRHYGVDAASALGVAEERTFKTLLVSTSPGAAPPFAIGVVAVSSQLSLKAMAAALGAKRVEMCAPAVAERATGSVVGGISPVGQRRSMPVVVDETCRRFATIFVSAGRRGLEIELDPTDLVRVLGAVVAPIGQPR